MRVRFHLQNRCVPAMDLVLNLLSVFDEEELLNGDVLGKTVDKLIRYSQDRDVGSLVRLQDEVIPGANIRGTLLPALTSVV